VFTRVCYVWSVESLASQEPPCDAAVLERTGYRSSKSDGKYDLEEQTPPPPSDARLVPPLPDRHADLDPTSPPSTQSAPMRPCTILISTIRATVKHGPHPSRDSTGPCIPSKHCPPLVAGHAGYAADSAPWTTPVALEPDRSTPNRPFYVDTTVIRLYTKTPKARGAV